MLPQYCLGGAMRRCLSCLSCSFCVIQLAIQVLWGGCSNGLASWIIISGGSCEACLGRLAKIWVGVGFGGSTDTWDVST